MKKVKSQTKTNIFVIAGFILFLFISPGFLCSDSFGQDGNSVATVKQMGKAFTFVATKASAAVVGVKTEKMVTQDSPGGPESPFDDEFFNQFFKNYRRFRGPGGPQPKSRQLGQASGFIISADGYVLTNNHVVDKADKITVILSDEREFEAKLIGTDPESDVAVVKIEAKDLPYLTAGNSDELEVGEWVLAVGNPFGLSQTVTAGIVSAKGRNKVGIETYEDFIQTDAAINPGNSGGPLLNLDGKVVGINTAIVSGSGGNMGIGFAIPINMAEAIYKQLVESGTVVRGFLGVSIQDLDPKLADYFGIKDGKGVLIPAFTEGSVAEKAGLKAGDIIVEMNGEPVGRANELQNRIAMLKPGTDIVLGVLRDGKKMEFTVKLGERPGAAAASGAGTGSATMQKLGLTVESLTADTAEQMGYVGEKGVLVTDVAEGSIGANASIVPGTLILEVNREAVGSAEEFQKAIDAAAEKGSALLRLKYKTAVRYVLLRLGD